MEGNFEIGMIGLGVMGRNLLLNMADHGFSVAGYDKDYSKVEALQHESGSYSIKGFANINEFISALRKPRAIILLVPAGGPVDSVISDLIGFLEKDDLIIDAGNSYFKDTAFRSRSLGEKGIKFLGMGISGGEEGARNGPSIMPGGQKEAYERVRPVMEAIAAKVNEESCVTYLGPGSSGHFVKTVHNGIEYALMQLISETYDLLKRGLRMNDDELHETYSSWNNGKLNSFLIEITGKIFEKLDDVTGRRLIDEILDVARQKGTGMWTSQSAMELQVPIPVIDIAVSMRNLSMYEEDRAAMSTFYRKPILRPAGDHDQFIRDLHDAFFVSMIIAYAQGFALLSAASNKYGFELNLEAVARIWRGGCIIRSALLEDIMTAFHEKPNLSNLLLNPGLSQMILEHLDALRRIVSQAGQIGVPAPGLMMSLAYFDAFRSDWLPLNLVQAQRDFFGAHTYERMDSKGTFHTEWQK